VLGELAAGGADGNSGHRLDEIGQVLASRFVEVVSGKIPQARPRCRPRPPPRGGKPRSGSSPIHNRNIDLEDAAAQAGISRSTSCGCSRRARVTPHQYLLRSRLRHARGGSADDDSPITDIAYDVGFGDLSNFVRHLPPRRRRLAIAVPQASRGISKGMRKIFQERARLH